MIDRKRPTGIIIFRPGSARVEFIPIAGIDSVPSVAWAHQDRGWIVTRNVGPIGSEVFVVGRDGKSRRLWSSGHQRLTHPVVSPDGRRIAFGSSMRESNVWLLEGL